MKCISYFSCVVEGTIDGLSPGEHGLAVHEAGDVSQGCVTLGDHYNPRYNLTQYSSLVIFIIRGLGKVLLKNYDIKKM